MLKRIVHFLTCAALMLSLTAVGAAAEGSGLIGVCMQNMSSSISELEAEALRVRGLGGRVTFTLLPGADHEDAAFYTAENLSAVLDFLDSAMAR